MVPDWMISNFEWMVKETAANIDVALEQVNFLAQVSAQERTSKTIKAIRTAKVGLIQVFSLIPEIKRHVNG